MIKASKDKKKAKFDAFQGGENEKKHRKERMFKF
jgi:hypothetical protein